MSGQWTIPGAGTMPRDGADILVRCRSDSGESYTVSARVKSRSRWLSVPGDWNVFPRATHWQPLPAPPA